MSDKQNWQEENTSYIKPQLEAGMLDKYVKTSSTVERHHFCTKTILNLKNPEHIECFFFFLNSLDISASSNELDSASPYAEKAM